MKTVNKNTRGFTYFEVLMAAMIVGVALVSATWAMSSTARTKSVYGQYPATAGRIAREIHELAAGLAREPSGQLGATSGAEVLALDSLIGAVFSPPIRADGTPDDSFPSWAQEVDLAVYATSDLATPLDESAASGLPPDSGMLYRLEVRVTEGGAEVGRFHWWITP
jgi:hypothetical protein